LNKIELVAAIKSNSGPILHTDPKLCYHSFHYQELEINVAQRNTLKRFDAFGIPESLKGKSVADLGCGVGGLLFEAMRRGASSGCGYEYDEKRCRIAIEIAKFLQLQSVTMCRANLSESLPEHSVFDIVFCCSLDAHVSDFRILYRTMSAICSDVCYFESNRNTDPEQIALDIRMIGSFNEILHLGLSSDDPYPRNIFILKKEKATYSRLSYPGNESNYLTYISNGQVEKYFQSGAVLKNIMKIKSIIGYHPNVLFPEGTSALCSKRKFIGKVLYDTVLTSYEKDKYKAQAISLLKFLRHSGVTHRDIHTKNILVENGNILLIDWELSRLTTIADLPSQQDIFGGDDIPYLGYVMSPIAESVASKLGIGRDEFQ
jgi:hypothetical protein